MAACHVSTTLRRKFHTIKQVHFCFVEALSVSRGIASTTVASLNEPIDLTAPPQSPVVIILIVLSLSVISLSLMFWLRIKVWGKKKKKGLAARALLLNLCPFRVSLLSVGILSALMWKNWLIRDGFTVYVSFYVGDGELITFSCAPGEKRCFRGRSELVLAADANSSS